MVKETIEKDLIVSKNYFPETYDRESERMMVEKAKLGDLDSFGMIYDKHVNQVYHYCIARLHNKEDAEDVTGEVFSKMLSGLGNYEYRKVPFIAWLMRISRNEVIDFTRRNGKKAHDGTLPEEFFDDKEIDPSLSVEKLILIEDARLAVSKLTESQREVILLRFASGLTYKEIALALGKKENNVRVLQHKGILKLRSILMQKYDEFIF